MPYELISADDSVLGEVGTFCSSSLATNSLVYACHMSNADNTVLGEVGTFSSSYV